MKKGVLLILMSLMSISLSAQDPQDAAKQSDYIPVLQYWKEHNIFQHLDASVTLGTTGIGIDVASPIGEYVQLRLGYAFMPHFHHKMSFGVQVGEDKAESDAKFERLSGMLEDMTGYQVDNEIDMIGVPTYNNFKLLVDVYPFKQNRHWHLTTGFYLGATRIAKAYNTTEDMSSLMAVGIYNHMYDRIMNDEPLISIGNISLDDPEVMDELYDKFSGYGRMGMPVGHFADGTTYMMEPDTDGMVKAKAKVNAFKPYLGFGYEGRLLKERDDWKVSFDCGAMFWGGTPSIILHDGTDIAKDVKGIDGKVGDYVDMIKGFKVFPVLNVRFTKTIF